MTSWQEADVDVGGNGVQGIPVAESQYALALWHPDRVGEVAVHQVFQPGGVDRFAGEPLDLGDTQAPSAELYLGGIAARLLAQRRLVEAAVGPRPVEISLEAAIRDPESILDMIRSAPLTDFHERVLRADKKGFEARFHGYVTAGRPGLWTSLELDVPGETNAAHLHSGLSPRRAKRGNREKIGRFQAEDEAPLNAATTDSLSTGGALYQEVHRYILALDTRYEKGQPHAGTGLVRIRPNPRTPERLDRLNAIRYPHAVRGGGRRHRHHNADMLKLEGLGHRIDRLWAAHHGEPLIRRVASGEDSTPVVTLSDELLDAEALYTALLAEYRLKQHGPKAVITEMAASVNGMEEIRGGLEEAAEANKDEGLFRLDLGAYGERAFTRTIQIAGASWQVMRQLQPSNLAEFESELLSTIKDELTGRGLLADPRNQSGLATGGRGALPAPIRALLDSAQFDAHATEAFARMTAAGHGATADRDLVNQYMRAVGDAAARRYDDGGRYREDRTHLLSGAAAERRAEDYPGTGRLLTFYGSYWTADGGMGPLEAMAAASGAYDHIESAGRSPLTDAEVRRQLERIGTESGHPVRVHVPFPDLPEGYLCETAHFVGLMPHQFEPRDVLSVVIPNGLATIQENLNPELADEIRLSSARARYRSIPTGLVRFLRSPRDGSLQYVLGHSDAELQEQLSGKERTLAIFFDKEDGSPSDLFQLLFPEENR